MESCKNCKHLKQLDFHGWEFECTKYVDSNGAQIMHETVIYAKVQMESKPAMCEEWGLGKESIPKYNVAI